jgi:hypothetical protein
MWRASACRVLSLHRLKELNTIWFFIYLFGLAAPLDIALN